MDILKRNNNMFNPTGEYVTCHTDVIFNNGDFHFTSGQRYRVLERDESRSMITVEGEDGGCLCFFNRCRR